MRDITYPPDTKSRLFAYGLTALRKIIPPRIRSNFGLLLFGVTPEVPVSLLELGAGSSPYRAMWVAALLAFFFCFIGTCVTTSVGGTFAGGESTRLYFSEDPANLLNYSVVVPAFVAFGCGFLLLVRAAWRDLESEPLLAPRSRVKLARLPMGAAMFAALLAASSLTVNYIRECMSPQVYALGGWYFDRLLSDGSRALGVAGTYYVILNFTLLLICCGVGVCFFPYAAVAAEVSRAIRAWEPSRGVAFEPLQAALANFTNAYITLKLFAAALMVNLLTWKWSQPQASINFSLMRLILCTVGVFVVSFPRYYLELEWFQFKVKAAAHRGEPIPSQSDDLRTWRVRAIANALDLSFGVAFVVTAFEGS